MYSGWGNSLIRRPLSWFSLGLLLFIWGWGGVPSAHAQSVSGSWDSLESPVVVAGTSVDLAAVNVNVQAGWLTGTTSLMEYSLDSINGTDGTWVKASDVFTPVQWQAGYLYIREQADPSNVRLLALIQWGRDGSLIFIDPITANITSTTTEGSISDSVVSEADPTTSTTSPVATNDSSSGATTDALVTVDPSSTADPSSGVTLNINTAQAIDQLTASDDHTLTIPVTGSYPSIKVPITGELLQALYDQKGSVIIACNQVSYTLPLSTLDPNHWIQSFTNPPSSITPITLNINITTPSTNDYAPLQSILAQQGSTLIGSPVAIQLNAQYAGQTVQVQPDQSDQSVSLTIPVPSDSNTPKVTTAVVYHTDGTLNPVPTVVPAQTASSSVASIHSWSNGTYALISHQASFTDISSSWSQADVTDMASRLVVNGEDGGVFAPDRLVTRAEFAAMMVRALGLSSEKSSITFSDVHDSDWYAGVVGSASNHGLIEGYNDTTFRPNQNITREEASEILMHAMKLTGLSTSITTSGANAQLNTFADRKQVSNWAVLAVALAVKYQIIEGVQNQIQPQSQVSRGQATAMIRRLLKQSGWI